MDTSLLSGIDAIAARGKVVVAADDGTVVALVKAVIESGGSASFYLTRAQADAVKEWYWTPERVASTGLAEVPDEEIARIREELGIERLTGFRFAPLPCGCGHRYGALDFLRQGVREHGPDVVKAIFALENSKLFQVNPSFTPRCPACEEVIPRSGDDGITYESPDYGGCSCCATV